MSQLYAAAHAMFGNTSPAMKRWAAEMVDPHTIGRERSFTVHDVAPGPPRMATG